MFSIQGKGINNEKASAIKWLLEQHPDWPPSKIKLQLTLWSIKCSKETICNYMKILSLNTSIGIGEGSILVRKRKDTDEILVVGVCTKETWYVNQKGLWEKIMKRNFK